MAILDTIQEMCRRFKMSDYLRAKGYDLQRAGKYLRCACPLPEHPNERTPSFYIREKDGIELFKCFGCGRAGNVFTIIKTLEKRSTGQILRHLAKQTGVVLGGYDENAVQTEPQAADVLSSFCDEDASMMRLTAYAQQFMRAHGCDEVVVDIVSDVYKYLDQKIEEGDKAAIEKALERLKVVMYRYKS
jgi:DNA primase